MGVLGGKLFQELSIDRPLTIPEVFKKKYVPSLNGLRAISIVLVIITHLQYTSDGPHFNFFLAYIANGSFGVQIFFVISGFLITGLLLKEKVITDSINIRKFYARRAIRIFPIFYLYVGVIVLFKLMSVIAIEGKQIFFPALYLQNFAPESWKGLLGHTWSLSVEEQFYLFWPMILCFLPGKYWLPIIFIISYNVLLRPYFYLHHSSNLFLLKGFFLYAPAIMSGALLSVALFKNWLKNAHTILTHPVFAFSLLIAALCYLPRALLVASFFSIPFDYITSSLFIALFIYYIVHCGQKNILYKILNNPIVNWIGVLSYSIYIWQQLFLVPQYIYNIHPWWVLWPQNVLLVLLVACVSYYFIEKPFLKLKKHFQ